MSLWMLRNWLRGYRVVDYGTELDTAQAAERALSTARLKSRKRSMAVRIIDKQWVVMIKGYNAKEEDG